MAVRILDIERAGRVGVEMDKEEEGIEEEEDNDDDDDDDDDGDAVYTGSIRYVRHHYLST